MSWFTSALDDIQKKVNDVIPQDALAKLTLNTKEMINERQKIYHEATRKEQAKDRLNKLLPWETSDSEREMLVEECKEAILALSSRKETFFGPYKMPRLRVNLDAVSDNDEDVNEKKTEDVDTTTDDEKDALYKEDEESSMKRTEVDNENPSFESLKKLKKLEPLPELLNDFDLDAHVGLIQKILQEDKGLVHMQATLSGGGDREKVFWRNYFFHCAYTRYEAGLSIDEIWSHHDKSMSATQNEVTDSENTSDVGLLKDGTEEEKVITFDSNTEGQSSSFKNSDETGDIDHSTETNDSEGSPSNGFELVDDSMNISTSGDPDLDELEAEIARELED